MQEESFDLHKYVYSSEMVEFVRAANGYCSFLEGLSGQEGKDFISEAVSWFSSVYASFIKLGSTEPSGDAPGEATVSEQEWAQIYSIFP